MKIQIEFLRSIWNTIDEQLRVHQNEILHRLESKLCDAISTMIRAVETEKQSGAFPSQKLKVKRLSFAAFLNERLRKFIQELQDWQSVFDPSWWIIIRISNPQVDQQLIQQPQSSGVAEPLSQLKRLRNAISSESEATDFRQSVFISSTTLSDERKPLAYSSLLSAQGSEANSGKLVDQIRRGKHGTPLTSIKDVRDLARVLSKVDPFTFALLSCDGVIKIYDSSDALVGFDFVFTIPDHLQNPRSLREILLSPPRSAPLNERFTLASLLSRSVFFIHASHFVHKSISPDNVIVFQDASCQLGTPFLVGFNRFRMDTTISHRLGDDNWERNIYRHPQRQGTAPDEDFSMQHDIYSLGVVLLEIGLNTSFTWPKWRDDGSLEWLPNTDIGLFDTVDLASRSRASSLKRKFVKMARERVPSLMGHKYTQVVVSCLTCLDRDNDGFGDEREFEDEDGLLVGVRFIEKVSLV
ncbi:MAG: hypothetical protein Q9195_008441 [Heterodermia aff. obscurata]